MSTYCNISATEMRDFLKIEKGWKETVSVGHTKEIVFEFPLVNTKPGIVVKVYTGIVGNDSRPVGGDAIRVCAVDTINNRGWIKTSRVYRTQGWKNNLQSRIEQVVREAKARN